MPELKDNTTNQIFFQVNTRKKKMIASSVADNKLDNRQNTFIQPY